MACAAEIVVSRYIINLLSRDHCVLLYHMTGRALGLIETRGLIGAIVATDAAAKGAAVVVTSVELTDATFLTIKIEGELGAVQAAVEVGAAAAEKVGDLIAAHVIPRPDSGLGPIMPNRRYVSKYHPEDTRPPLDDDDSEVSMPSRPRPGPSAPTGKKERPPKRRSRVTKQAETGKDDLNKMTVGQLRQLARTMEDFPLKGRAISMANKKQLIDAIKSVVDMDN